MKISYMNWRSEWNGLCALEWASPLSSSPVIKYEYDSSAAPSIPNDWPLFIVGNVSYYILWQRTGCSLRCYHHLTSKKFDWMCSTKMRLNWNFTLLLLPSLLLQSWDLLETTWKQTKMMMAHTGHNPSLIEIYFFLVFWLIL